MAPNITTSTNAAAPIRVRAYDPGNPTLQALAGAVIGTPGPGNRITASQNPVFNRSEIFGASAAAELPLGELTLSSISGYRTWTNRNSSESDGTRFPILGAPGGGTIVRVELPAR